MFNPDFSKLTAEGVLTAIGHAFFTLSIAGGAVFAYGSYLDGGTSIARTSFGIAIIDTLVALMAGLAIFPIVFAYGLEPGAAAGPGVRDPADRIRQDAGRPESSARCSFVMLVVAAWTSSISMLEAIVEWLQERGMGRASGLGRASPGPPGCSASRRCCRSTEWKGFHPPRLHRAFRRQDAVRPLRLSHREYHAAAGAHC